MRHKSETLFIVVLMLLTVAMSASVCAQDIVRTSRYERATTEDSSASYGNFDVQSIKEQYHIPADTKVISPSEMSDVVIEVFRHNAKIVKGMSVPMENISSFFVSLAPEEVYALCEYEPVRIGAHSYSFKAANGELTLHYVTNGKVTTVDIADSNVWMTEDGYMLRKLEIHK